MLTDTNMGMTSAYAKAAAAAAAAAAELWEMTTESVIA